MTLLTVMPSIRVFFAALCMLMISVFSIALSQSASADILPANHFTINVNPVNGSNLADNRSNCVDGAIFRTVQHGVTCALYLKKSEISSLVNITAGTYRESVNLWLSPNQLNETPMVIKGVGGEVIISGSNVYEGWVNLGNGLYQLRIPEYPLESSPQLAASNMPDLTRLREMVFVDGVLLDQIEANSTQQSGDGTFKVVADGTVTIAPPTSLSNSFMVEVGVRDFVWKQNSVSNITVEGLILQHATSKWENGRAAMVVAGSDSVRLTGLTIRWNNGEGLFLSDGENVVAEGIIASDNGKGGMGTHKLRNSLITDSVTNRNNWRGDLGGYYSWWVGNKFTNSRGLEIRNHLSVDNQARGLWLDLDNEDVLIDNATVINNRRDGIFLEVSQGPMTISNSRFNNNGENGIRGANAEKVTLDNVELVDNKQEQLFLTADFGDGPRKQNNFETGETMLLWLKDWTIQNSVIGNSSQEAQETALVRSTLVDDQDGEDWSIFLANYQGNNNCYFHANNPLPFKISDPQVTNSPANLMGWKSETGEAGSQFYDSFDSCFNARIPYLPAPAIDGYPEIEWEQTPLVSIDNQILGAEVPESDFSASFRASYDAENLYVVVAVLDDDIRSDSTEFWQDDNVELFIDFGNERGSVYDNNDYQLIFGANGYYTVGPNSVSNLQPEYAVLQFDGGYVVEVAVPLLGSLSAVPGSLFGFDVHVTDDDQGGPRENKLSWRAEIDDSWRNPNSFGQALFLPQ